MENNENLTQIKKQLMSQLSRFYNSEEDKIIFSNDEVISSFSDFILENILTDKLNEFLSAMEKIVNAKEHDFSAEAVGNYAEFNYMSVPIEGTNLKIKCYYKGKNGPFKTPSIKFYNGGEHSFMSVKRDKKEEENKIIMFTQFREGDYEAKKDNFAFKKQEFVGSNYGRVRSYSFEKNNVNKPNSKLLTTEEIIASLDPNKKRFFESVVYIMETLGVNVKTLSKNDASLLLNEFYESATKIFDSKNELKPSEALRLVAESIYHREGQSPISDEISASGDDPTKFYANSGEPLSLTTSNGQPADINLTGSENFCHSFVASTVDGKEIASYSVFPVENGGFTLFKSNAEVDENGDKKPSSIFNISLGKDPDKGELKVNLSIRLFQGKTQKKDCFLVIYDKSGANLTYKEQDVKLSEKGKQIAADKNGKQISVDPAQSGPNFE